MTEFQQPYEPKGLVERKHRCPKNGTPYPPVSQKTILLHLREPWRHRVGEHRYFYCDDPACDVVYFTTDDEMILVERLRTSVGVKSRSSKGMICYCYGITKEVARSDPASKAFVVAQTSAKNCACESRNPFGRCCLKDFPQ